MKIRDVMTPMVECVLADRSLKEVAEKMKQQDVGVLVVVDDGDPVGLVTDRDVVVRCVAEGRDPAATAVRDVMSRKIVWCDVGDEVDDAARVMEQSGVRRLLVRDDGQMQGVLSLGDLAKHHDSLDLVGRVLSSVCLAE